MSRKNPGALVMDPGAVLVIPQYLIGRFTTKRFYVTVEVLY